MILEVEHLRKSFKDVKAVQDLSFKVNQGELLISYDFFNKKDNMVSKKLIGDLNIELNDNRLSIIKYIYRNIQFDNESILSKIMRFCENMLWLSKFL